MSMTNAFDVFRTVFKVVFEAVTVLREQREYQIYLATSERYSTYNTEVNIASVHENSFRSEISFGGLSFNEMRSN